MSLLERMKDLITVGDDQDRLTAEKIGERRKDVREEIGRLEDELRRLRSDEGRREALAEADSPEEVGRRRRLLQDRLDGLRKLDSELVERQRAGKNEEMRARLREVVEDLPDLADAYAEAMSREREARERYRKALSEAVRVRATLYQRDLAPELELSGAQVDRLERLADQLPGAFTLEFLRRTRARRRSRSAA